VHSDALKTEAGQKHFESARQLFQDPFSDLEEWSPKICETQNCTVQILHIAKKGYDEGAVERLVELLEIPAKVVYLGEFNHTEAIWKAYTKRAGALMYRCLFCAYMALLLAHPFSIRFLHHCRNAASLNFGLNDRTATIRTRINTAFPSCICNARESCRASISNRRDSRYFSEHI
jgi:hypothetical protein